MVGSTYVDHSAGTIVREERRPGHRPVLAALVRGEIDAGHLRPQVHQRLRLKVLPPLLHLMNLYRARRAYRIIRTRVEPAAAR